MEAFRDFHPEVHGRPNSDTLEKYGWQILQSDPEPTDTTKVHERGPVEYRDGVPYWTWITRDPTPEEAAQMRERQFRAINRERERRLAEGSAFPVNGVTDPIPLTGRPFDQTVYLALLTRAQGYKAAGVTDPVLRIRAGDDKIHMLTPDQMIQLISQAMTWVEQVMAVSWAMKDGTAPFEAGIPDDFVADEYWP
jgi:hypothetical protein